MTEFVPRPGALRYKNLEGEWSYANPRDLMYSTVTMSATEYWSDGSWKQIHEDDADDTSFELPA